MERVATLLVLAAIWSPFLRPESRESQKGLAAYREGDYIEALTRFQEAKAQSEEPALYDFNSGVAAQGAGNPEAAVNYYLKARGAEALTPGAADYNRGSALAQLGKPQEALGALRQALRANPTDDDARYNYEVLLRQMQADSSQGEDNQDNQKDSQSQEQDSSKPQDGNQENQDQEQDGQGEQQQNQQQEQQKGDTNPAGEDEGDQPQAQPTQAVPLDRQQAERLLNALMQGERDLLKSRLKGDRRKRAEKDW
jgi:tetratricopeptide (TPR) repeat protein